MFNWIRKKWKILVLLALLAANGSVIVYIFSIKKADSTDFVSNIKEGKELAAQYCQSCHMLPDPSLLTKEMWGQRVMLHMGPFLGITSFNGTNYLRAPDVDPNEYFPPKPIIDSLKWQHIIDYYVAMAPVVMPDQQKDVPVKRELPFFTVESPDSSFYSKVSMSPYVKIDNTQNPVRLLVENSATNTLYVLNPKLGIENAVKTAGPIVDLDFQQDGILGCSIGKSMAANNSRDGSIYPIDIYHKGILKKEPRFDSLARPCKISHADLNGDGKMDYIISQFGNLKGDLSWMENKGNGKFEKHILRNKSGPISTIVQDYNHDGLPDIWALFGQGEEGIFLFTNKGKGVFEEKQVLRFPPSYGSVSFDLIDFNKDGFPDIIYTAGDNGDFTDILKPYHGVYIFINDGKNNFTQKYFYPINGCFKAIVRDFDGDGQLDIATISFYPSAIEPEEPFIYLENIGNFKFQPYSLPPGTRFQKGITMDVGDIDGDGKPDLILGNGFYTSKPGLYKEPLFLVLKNRTTRKK